MSLSARRVLRWIASFVVVVVLTVLVVYLSGILSSQEMVEPGSTTAPFGAPEPGAMDTATREMIPAWYETVGTVESRTSANVAARISAPVITVTVDAGAQVTEGQELVFLDDRELKARKNQAEGALAGARAALAESQRAQEAAEAVLAQAESNYNRTKQFHGEEVASDAELEAAEASYRQAQAGVARARAGIERAKAEVDRSQEAVSEAGVALGYTRIVAPITGEIARRMVDPGDLAWPGRTLVVVHDREQVRLRASVREGLWGEVAVGREVEVTIPAVERTFKAKVEEVEPAADPRTRSFVVKAPLPGGEMLYPGMFGRLRIKRGTRSAVLVPREAVIEVGQLATVLVRSKDRWVRRYVRRGPDIGERIEILSGLSGGEVVGW